MAMLNLVPRRSLVTGVKNLCLAEILTVDQEERFKPFPFCLAHPLKVDVNKLGDV